jgi:hypothetical protein
MGLKNQVLFYLPNIKKIQKILNFIFQISELSGFTFFIKLK